MATSSPRDIKQRDPLSAYLFILAIEGLTRLYNDASTSNIIHGIRIARLESQIIEFMALRLIKFFCLNFHP